MAGAEIIPRTVGDSFVPQASAAPRNAGAPYEALSQAAGAGLDLANKMQEASDQHALNQAGLALQKQLDNRKIAYAKDPDPATAAQRFETDAQKDVNAAIDGLPQNTTLRDSFADQWGLHIEAARADVQLDAVKRIADETAASTLAVLDDTSQRSAYANPAERKLLAKQASDALAGAVQSGAMTAKAAQVKASKWSSNLAEFDARRAILTDPVGALELLKDPKNFPDLDGVKRLELQEQADARIRTAERENRVALTAEKADIRATVADTQTQLSAGLPVDGAALTDLGQRVAQTGDPMLAHRYGSLQAQVTTQDKLRGASPPEVDRVIDNLTTAGASHPTPQLAAALSSARTFRTRMQAGLKQDQLTWAASQGVVKLNPLALNGTDNAAALRARIVAGDTAAKVYGRGPQYLTPSETAQLKNVLATADPQTKLQQAEMLIGGLGETHAASAFAQIAPHDGVWAQAGVLAMAGKKDAALDALTGQALLHAEKGKNASPLLPSDGARKSDDGAPMVNRAFHFAPELGAHVLSTADAIYAARARSKGLSGKDAEETDAGQQLYARAVQEAAGAGFDANGTQYGGIVTFHGRAVAVPATIKADDFEAVMKGLDSNMLARASVSGGVPVTADGKPFANLGDAYLIAVGDGRYVVSTTDPDEEAHLVQDAKTHSAYVLDLERVLPWMHPPSRVVAFDTTHARGMVKPGNVDPWNRPILHNANGSYSTTSSMSIGTDAGEVLIPTVINGKRLSKEDAIVHVRKTGENLGTFDTPENADVYATALHNEQDRRIRGSR
jgi:hypothetical protein